MIRKIPRRITGMFLCLCLSLPPRSFALETAAAAASFPVPREAFSIPPEFGEIEESFLGGGPFQAFIIKDAHSIPSAQKNISKLIDYFQRNYGIRVAAGEGAAGRLDPMLFRSFPDKALLEKILNTYFEKGELAGINLSAVTGPGTASFYGLEDPALFIRGTRLYMASARKKEAAQKKILTAMEILAREKKRFYSPRLLAADHASHAFLLEKLALPAFLKVLSEAGGPPEKGSLLQAVLDAEKEGVLPEEDAAGLRAEAGRLARTVKAALPSSPCFSIQKKFHREYQRYLVSETGAGAFASFLYGAARQCGLDSGLAGPLREKAVRYGKIERIEGSRFFAELERYRRKTESGLIKTEEEKILAAKSAEFQLFYRLAGLSLTREQWEEVKLVLRKKPLAAAENEVQVLPPVDEGLSSNIAFYSAAEERDRMLAKNFLSLLERHQAKRGVIVAGGFHAEGLCRYFKERNISFVLVRPAIDEFPAEEFYSRHMEGRVSFHGYLKARDGAVSFYEAFAESFSAKAKEFSGERRKALFERWRGEVIRGLSADGRLEEARHYLSFIDKGFDPAEAPQKALIRKIDGLIERLRDLEENGEAGAAKVSAVIRASFTQPPALGLLLSVHEKIPEDLVSSLPTEKADGSPGLLLKTSPPFLKTLSPGAARNELRKPAASEVKEFVSSLQGAGDVWSAESEDTERGIEFRVRIADLTTEAGVRAAAEKLRAALQAKFPAHQTEVSEPWDDGGFTLSVELETHRYRLSGIDFTRTLPSYGEKSEFVEAASESERKSIEEIRKDLDGYTAAYHRQMELEYGFIGRDESAAARTVYQVFDRLAAAYNKLSEIQGKPRYRGKLFIIDSPQPNSLVISEHDDVYLQAGLVRAIAEFAGTSGGNYSVEEMIAAALAHELAHILQNSSYEGLSYSRWESQREKFKRRIHEFMALKRNAEWDADRGTVILLALARDDAAYAPLKGEPLFEGYSPSMVLPLLEFLSRISRGPSRGHLLSFHPHPKLRISGFKFHMYSDRLSTSTWENPLGTLSARNGVKTEDYKQFHGKNGHISHYAHLLRNEEDLDRALKRAGSLKELGELIRIAAEKYAHAAVKRTAETKDSKVYFAKIVYAKNLISAARRAAAAAHAASGAMPDSEPSMPVPYKGMHIAREPVESFQLPPETGEPPGFAADAEALKVEFRKEMGELERRLLYSRELDTGQKMKALGVLRKISREFWTHFEQVGADDFSNALETGEMLPARLGGDLLSGHAETVLPALRRIPFSVYERFGQSTLDRMRPAGNFFSGVQTPIYEEVEDSSFYESDPRLLEMDNAGNREMVYEALHYEFLYKFHGPAFRRGRLSSSARERAAQLAPDLPAEWGIRNYGIENSEFKKKIVEIMMGKIIPLSDNEKDLARRYFEAAGYLPEAPSIRSPVYEAENGLEPPPGLVRLDRLIDAGQDRLYEILNQPAAAARALAEKLSSAGREQFAAVVNKELSIYSKYFKTRVLRSFIQLDGVSAYIIYPGVPKTRGLFPDHGGLFEVLVKETGAHDAYDLMTLYLTEHPLGDSGEETAAVKIDRPAELFSRESGGRVTPAEARKFLEFMERVYFVQRPAGAGLLDRRISRSFIKARVRALDGRAPDKETVFRDIELLSRLGIISFKESDTKAAEKTDFIKGEIGPSETGKVLPSDVFPAAFFGPPEEASEQLYFRRLMGFGLEELQAIARNQNRLLDTAPDSPLHQAGRFQISLPELDLRFVSLLNSLIIIRLKEEITGEAEGVTPENFEKVLSAELEIQKVPHIHTKTAPYEAMALLLTSAFKDKNDWKNFFSGLYRGFYIWNPVSSALELDPVIRADGTDGFFLALSGKDRNIEEFFPLFHGLMGKVIYPRAKTPAASSKTLSYLRVFSENVDILGAKGAFFKRFMRRSLQDGKTPFHTTRTLREHLAALTRYLDAPSLFRDGIIDLLERLLFPEIHGNTRIPLSRIRGVLNSGRRSGGETGDLLLLVKESMIELPSQWENLAEEAGKLSVPSERRVKIMSFYRSVIPLLADPQRQIRYGAAAMLLWRRENPRPAFAEELEAVRTFFPSPSEYRDDMLDALFEHHDFPALPGGADEPGVPAEMVRKAERLYSVHFKMEYDQELTSMDAAAQGLQSVLTPASREARKNAALWIVTKKPEHMPRALLDIRRQKNIDFSDLPAHLRYVPASLKREVMKNVLTGENGILHARSGKEHELKKQFALDIFDHFFPPGENDPAVTGVSPEALAAVRLIFMKAVDRYDDVRGALIFTDLMIQEEKLLGEPFGRRLAVLLGNLGPIGIKIGQFLSENEKLIPHAGLRREFARLKGSAKPLNKIAVLEALIAAGYRLEDIQLGRRLASASMKQVHEGKLRNANGEWEDVVFKVLRPALNRMVDEDLEVLSEVLKDGETLEAIRRVNPLFNPGDLVKTVRRMLDEERQFLVEVQNAKELKLVLENYPEGAFRYPPIKRVAVPEMKNPAHVNAAAALAEERVRGVVLAEYFEALADPAFKQELLERLTSQGMELEDARRIFRHKPDLVRRLIRSHLLYQVFSKGLFHGDLHSENIMITPEEIYFIDTGLFGRFNQGPPSVPGKDQLEAAREIAKGILTHDTRRTAGGIEQLLSYEGATLGYSRRETEALIARHFRRSGLAASILGFEHGGIKQLLNNIGAIVLSRGRGPGSDTFGIFMKGLTQSLWLFPAAPLSGLDALEDLSMVTEMTPAEKRRAFFYTGIPNILNEYHPVIVVKKIIRAAAGAFKGWLFGFDSRMRKRKEREAAAQALSVGRQDAPVPALRKKTIRIQGPFYGSGYRQKPEETKNRVLGKTILRANGSVRAGLNEETTALLLEHYPQLRREDIQEAADVYAHYYSILEGNYDSVFGSLALPSLSAREEALLQGFFLAESGNAAISEKEIFQRVLASGLTKKHLETKYALRKRTYVDLFGFKSYYLTIFAGKYTELWLSMLDAADNKDPAPNGMRRREGLLRFLKRNPEEFLPGWKGSNREDLNIRLNFAVRTEPLPAIVRKDITSENIPAFAINRKVRAALVNALSTGLTEDEIDSEAVPGRYVIKTDDRLDPMTAVLAVRTRYDEDPHARVIEVEVHSPEENRSVKMRFSEEEYALFLQEGLRPVDFRIMEYVPRSELRSHSNESDTWEQSGTRRSGFRPDSNESDSWKRSGNGPGAGAPGLKTMRGTGARTPLSGETRALRLLLSKLAGEFFPDTTERDVESISEVVAKILAAEGSEGLRRRLISQLRAGSEEEDLALQDENTRILLGILRGGYRELSAAAARTGSAGRRYYVAFDFPDGDFVKAKTELVEVDKIFGGLIKKIIVTAGGEKLRGFKRADAARYLAGTSLADAASELEFEGQQTLGAAGLGNPEKLEKSAGRFSGALKFVKAEGIHGEWNALNPLERRALLMIMASMALAASIDFNFEKSLLSRRLEEFFGGLPFYRMEGNSIIISAGRLRSELRAARTIQSAA